MLMDIFVAILCLIMLSTGIFGFWMENIGFSPKKTESKEAVQETTVNQKKNKKN